MPSRQALESYFHAGVAAASAWHGLPAALPKGEPSGHTLVLGCGKAAAEMAAVAHAHLAGPVSGCVVTRYGHGTKADTGNIAVIEASHPLPDAASLAAGQRIRELAASARADDRVIFLISGGGSALLCDPIPGLSLEVKAQITRHLVGSGAAIGEINLVRRHLSQVKGGRLAAWASAAADDMHSFLISDVVGDDPVAIASGPTITSHFEPEAALEILARSGWQTTPALAAAIRAASVVAAPSHQVKVIAKASDALNRIAAQAVADGVQLVRLGDDVEGDAAATGRAHAERAMALIDRPGRQLLLSGGELTVQLRHRNGRGGPNLEYLTGLMAALPETAPVAALAADSDGIDGTEDNAGGYFDAQSRAAAADCEAALASNRSYDLFARLGGLIITGPTRTNVNDIRMIAVGDWG